MVILDDELLDELVRGARLNPRRRLNLNLHGSDGDACQRFFNAVEPDSYIRPHRHLRAAKPETIIALRGRFAAFVFHDDGVVESVIPFSANGPARGIDLPAGVWHSVVSLESGSVFFETKPGPYLPLIAKDWAPWAPAEGSAEALDYLQLLRQRGESASGCGT